MSETTFETQTEEVTYSNIHRRVDGSYQIDKTGMPCHIPNEQSFLNEGKTPEEAAEAYAEWAEQWEAVNTYALAHPDEVIIETPPSPPTLEELKTRKNFEISAAFNDCVAGNTMTTLGFPMQFNVQDCNMVDGAVRLMEMTEQTTDTGYLTDANNVNHEATYTQMKQTLTEMLAAFAAAHAKKQELRAAVEAATTAEAVEAIAW